MLEAIHDRVLNIKKNCYIKAQSVFRLYKTYIVISIFLGIVLELKLLDNLSDKPVQLINQFTNISNSNPIDYSLIFSTSAAILATIFTIIFVLLTVFIQISDGYMSAKIFHSNEAKNLMRLYFVTIVLSLMMLKTTYQFPTLVLTLTFACILSLYPFLHNISDKIVYDVGLRNINKKISLQITSNDEVSTINEIMSLREICISSIEEEQLLFFSNIMSIFSAHIYMVKQKKMIEAVEEFGNQYLYILSFLVNENPITNCRKKMTELLLREVKRYMSNCTEFIKCDSLEYQMFLLKPIGIDMIKASFDDKSIRVIINILWLKFYYLQENRNVNIIEEMEQEDLKDILVKYLGEMAKESFKYNRENPFTFSVALLWKIGAELFQAKEEHNHPISQTLLSTIVEQLNEIEKLIDADFFEKKFEESKIQPFNEQNKTYLDEFKELYDQRKRDFRLDSVAKVSKF